VIRDDAGAEIGRANISLSANGHTSFVLANQFGITGNRRGAIEFDTPANGQISVLGLRFTASGAFTTIPVLANLNASGGSMAHFASGGGWATRITLINTGASSADLHLRFFDDEGAPLSLPIAFPQEASTSAPASGVDRMLAANSTLIVDLVAADGQSVATGSVQLTSNGSLGGFIVFRSTGNGQEAVAPLEARKASSYILAFDNTAGVVTGLAIANTQPQSGSIPVVLRNEDGSQLGTDAIVLPANGHRAFALPDRFPATAKMKGTIEFNAPPGAQISVLGLRFISTGAFTSIPAIAR
jgi:hypothetical protein